MSSTTHQTIIRGAGGLLWRHSSQVDYEIAIIHRRRYGDWTLPKGKLNEGESWKEAALREVKEETGYDAELLRFAGAIGYQIEGTEKVVCFWHMIAIGEPGGKIDEEVADILWLPIQVARSRLQYPVERVLLEVWDTPDALCDVG